MATMSQLEQAIAAADKAGDTAAATHLAGVLSRASQDKSNFIPDTQIPETMPQAPEPTLGQKAVGTAETALALGTGATSGQVGMIAGLLNYATSHLVSHFTGIPAQTGTAEEAAVRGIGDWSYNPKTVSGQEQTNAAAGVLQNAVPLMPLGAEVGAAASGLKGALPAARMVLAKELPAAVQEVKGVQGATPMAQPVKAIPGYTANEVPAAQSGPIGAPEAVETPTAAPVEAVTPADIGTLAKKAASGGVDSTAAKQLAEMAKVNPEAQAAADHLGIELPVDVYSDSQSIKEAAGHARSQVGSEASGTWRDTVIAASEKADEAMRQLDASPDIASVSEKVRQSLGSTREQLHADAVKVYDQVDAAVPKDTVVELPTLRKTLGDITKELGGAEGLSTAEKKLQALLDNGNVTYGRLAREKNLIGQAVAGKESPYGSMESASLKRLYGAIAEDQLVNVGKIGGEDLRTQLRGANLLYAQERALGKRIVNAFGKETDGSISSILRSAIEQGVKGNTVPLTKVLKVVPADLQKEAVASALMTVTRAKGGEIKGGFGFSEFATTYRGLRANAPVYSQIIKVLGPEADKLLSSLYSVSKRVTDAKANVLTTGKANQPMVEAMNADSLVSKVFSSKTVKTGVAGAVGFVGSPVAGMAAHVAVEALGKSSPGRMNAISKLFASEEFKALATEAATKRIPSPQAVRRVATSPAFKKFAEMSNIGSSIAAKEKWLLSGLTTTNANAQE
jgi:hypothetical protein